MKAKLTTSHNIRPDWQHRADKIPENGWDKILRTVGAFRIPTVWGKLIIVPHKKQ